MPHFVADDAADDRRHFSNGEELRPSRPIALARVACWIQERGAHWIRLGVVVGNTRAERFWHRQSYVQVRERGPLQMGQRTNLLRVLVKPLNGGTLEQYLALVARDRPETA